MYKIVYTYILTHELIYWHVLYPEGYTPFFGSTEHEINEMKWNIRIIWSNWIGQVNRMDIKGKISQVLDNNPHGNRVKGQPKTDGRTLYKQY